MRRGDRSARKELGRNAPEGDDAAWKSWRGALQAEGTYNTKGAPQDPDFQGKVMRLQFPVGVPKRI